MSHAHHILVGLSKIGLLLRAGAWRQSGQTGLTPTQAQILSHLTQRGAARVGAIAEQLGVTQPTASEAVAALVAKGYVTRDRDPEDARAARLRATPTGRRLGSMSSAWPDELLSVVEGLDEAEQGRLLRTLTTIIRGLQAEGAIPIQRMCATCTYFRPFAHADRERPHHCAFVKSAFGESALRLDCGDHVEADASLQHANWTTFVGASD